MVKQLKKAVKEGTEVRATDGGHNNGIQRKNMKRGEKESNGAHSKSHSNDRQHSHRSKEGGSQSVFDFGKFMKQEKAVVRKLDKLCQPKRMDVIEESEEECYYAGAVGLPLDEVKDQSKKTIILPVPVAKFTRPVILSDCEEDNTGYLVYEDSYPSQREVSTSRKVESQGLQWEVLHSNVAIRNWNLIGIAIL